MNSRALFGPAPFTPLALAILGIGVVLGVVMSDVYTTDPTDTTELDELCKDTFGDEYESQGLNAASTPPTLQCVSESGQMATMPLPYGEAKERGLNSTAYRDEWGEEGGE